MSRLRVFIRPFIALLFGWLVGYLDVFKNLLPSLHYDTILLLLVVLPLLLALGVIAALTGDRRNEHYIALSILTGVLAVMGWYGYWYPIVSSADDAAAARCQSATYDSTCHHGLISPEMHFATAILIYGWIISVILVLVSSSITGWIVKHVHKISPLKE